MILCGVNGISTNDVDVQFLHKRNIPFTSSWIRKRINKSSRTVLIGGVCNGRLICHSYNIEFRSIFVEEFSSLLTVSISFFGRGNSHLDNDGLQCSVNYRGNDGKSAERDENCREFHTEYEFVGTKDL
jgi:hypothetical protein